MSTTTPDIPPGPLRWPVQPRERDASRALRRLGGHRTSQAWLPAGLDPKLDEARDEHLRLRGIVAAAIGEHGELRKRFAAEDEARDEGLRDAVRKGRSEPADKSTPSDEREVALADVERRLWAGAVVLAEHVEHVVELVRELESDLLGQLRDELPGVEKKKVEAQRLMAEARAAEARIAGIGMWIQDTSDDRALGGQPAPQGDAGGSVSREILARSVARPWYREQERAA